MSIIRWSPWLDEEFDEIGSMFPVLSQSSNKPVGFVPAVDVYQDKNSITVETSLPGINPENVEIAIENDVLTIKGKVEHKQEVEEKDYYRKEVRKGSFYRSINLPTHVVGDKAEAIYENGILKITAPKFEGSKQKTIKIKTIKDKK